MKKLRDGDFFLLFWNKVLTESKQLDIDEPALERKRKASWWIRDVYNGSLNNFFHENFEGSLWQIVLDFLINAIRNR